MHELRRHMMKRCLPGVVIVGAFGALATPLPSAQAGAPPCRYTVSTDTVFDKDTGLEWQRVVSSSTYTWADAGTYCSGLSLNGSGWRLPSIQELQTIVDESTLNPAVDISAFPNTPGTYFWSSSVYAGDPSSAWNVDFYYGYVNANGKTNPFRVRCVR